MNHPFRIADQLIFRSSVMPLPRGRTGINTAVLDSPVFREALYLASPDFFREWTEKQKTDERLESTLYKYGARAMTRATPFGLFAGLGLAEWSTGILQRGSPGRNTRLDMNFVCGLGQQIAQYLPFREHLIFFPNDSILDYGETIRYVEYRYRDTERICVTSDVEKNEYLAAVLSACREGADMLSLIRLLAAAGIEEEEARAFVNELIDARLLISDIEPNVTGSLFQERLCEKLTGMDSDPFARQIREALSQALAGLKQVDEKIGNDPAMYSSIRKLLEPLPVKFDPRYLFQADMFFPEASGGPDATVKKVLSRAFQALNRLSAEQESVSLREFRERFAARYEDQEVPLDQALDGESGVGFGGPPETYTPLIEGISPGGGPAAVPPYRVQDILLQRKLISAIENQEQVCELTDEELSLFPLRHDDLPDTLAVFFKVIDRDGCRVQINAAGGPTATALISRFAHGDKKVADLAASLARHEQDMAGESLIAEVVYLPENRVGNILLRPVLRQYEIAYLTRPGVEDSCTLPVSDLLVSLVNGRIVLRSRKLNRRIIPRLSSAHNYLQFGLPVYRFLCALQTEGLRTSLGFSWGAVAEGHRFLPRVVYKGAVLAPAVWVIPSDAFRASGDDASPERISADLRSRFRLPPEVVVADADNLLYISLDDQTAIRVLAGIAIRRGTVRLEEYLGEGDEGVVRDVQGNTCSNEFVAFLLREEKEKQQNNPSLPVDTGLQRRFFPGSEWAYYKLYCGDKTADEVLVHCIGPLVKKLRGEQLIDKWFWIRYADPEKHLRVRFHCTSPEAHLHLAEAFRKAAGAYGDKIWKVQADTYQRELERYGGEAILPAETLFMVDSDCTLELIRNIDGDEGEGFRWRFGLLSVMAWLQVLRPVSGAAALLEKMKTGAFQQFGAGKDLKVQLDARFREYRDEIRKLFRDNDNGEETGLLKQWIAGRNKAALPAIEKALVLAEKNVRSMNYDYFCSSIIHMSMNRLNRSAQNMHELVTYDLLYRHVRSEQARESKTGNG